MSDSLFTIQETAEYLKVHWQTVRNFIKQGNIPICRIGRRIRIRENDLQNFIIHRKKKDIHEIEIRFQTKKRKDIEKKLLEIGSRVTYHGHVIDHWFVPVSIKNMEQKNTWYDTGKGFGLRIREQDNGYTGKVSASLEIKRLVVPYHHDTCIEHLVDVASYDETYRLLKLMNFKEIITIDKDRIVYAYKDLKVVIDDIKNFVTGVEIEHMTSCDRKEIVPRLKRFAKILGLDIKKDLMNKSVTYLAMGKCARF
jgi:predicted adenylyl cyclase CyaB